MKQVNEALKSRVFRRAPPEDEETELLEHLKTVFQDLNTREEKLTLLTLFPENWIGRKLRDTFDLYWHIVTDAHQLLMRKSPLSSPD